MLVNCISLYRLSVVLSALSGLFLSVYQKPFVALIGTSQEKSKSHEKNLKSPRTQGFERDLLFVLFEWPKPSYLTDIKVSVGCCAILDRGSGIKN